MLEISESVLIKTIILLYKKHTHIMPEFVSQSITVRTQHRIHTHIMPEFVSQSITVRTQHRIHGK